MLAISYREVDNCCCSYPSPSSLGKVVSLWFWTCCRICSHSVLLLGFGVGLKGREGKRPGAHFLSRLLSCLMNFCVWCYFSWEGRKIHLSFHRSVFLKELGNGLVMLSLKTRTPLHSAFLPNPWVCSQTVVVSFLPQALKVGHVQRPTGNVVFFLCMFCLNLACAFSPLRPQLQMTR